MEKRTLLAVALSFLVFVLWAQLFGPEPPPPSPPSDDATAPAAQPGDASPPGELGEPVAVVADTPGDSGGPLAFQDATAAPQDITVETPLYTAVFSTLGGGLTSFIPSGYLDPNHDPLELMVGASAQPELELDADGPGPAFPISLRTTVFEPTRISGRGELPTRELVFTAVGENGMQVERRYRFLADDYTIEMSTNVIDFPNRGGAEATLIWSAGLPITEGHAEMDRGEFKSMVSVGENIEKKDLKKFNPDQPDYLYEGIVRWASTRTRYFISGVFAGSQSGTRASAFGERAESRIGYSISSSLLGTTATVEQRLYVGPIEPDRLERLGEGIERTVGFHTMPMSSLFGWFGDLIYRAMKGLYGIIPNYGVVILLLALANKVLFFPLTRRSTAAMKRMQEVNQALQPEMQALKEKYKNDSQRLNTEMMALWKKHGVNPLTQMGGCVWMLPQMPIFMALYGVLRTAIELRQAPFMLWINDLSAPDVLFSLGVSPIPFIPGELHLLPILMAVTTILMQKRTITDPRQKSMMYIMPIVMLFIFYRLPSGLNLYWTVTNLLSWGEQLITKGKATPVAAKAA